MELKYINKFYYGTEVEMASSRRFYRRDYHGNREKPVYGFWTCEGDSSINVSAEHEYTYEFITASPFLVEDYMKHLKKLESLFDSFSQISFNSSTGAHIHISLPNKTLLRPFLDHSFIATFRKTLFNKVEKVHNKHGADIDEWKRMYGRRYAKRIERFRDDGNKYFEIRVNSRKQTLEFRGFHLQTAKSWEMVFDMYTAFFEALDRTISLLVKDGVLSAKRFAYKKVEAPPKEYGTVRRVNPAAKKNESTILVKGLDVLMRRLV